jgi:hypothetical protein
MENHCFNRKIIEISLNGPFLRATKAYYQVRLYTQNENNNKHDFASELGLMISFRERHAAPNLSVSLR